MTTSPQPFSLPNDLTPSSLDTLPVLSAILSRLQTPNSTSAGSPPSASPSQNTSGSLAIKDIPAATDDLKHKLQKARAQIKALPDIERSLKEQEEEIRELESKIERQREVLEGLKEVGGKARRERAEGGGVMEGIET